jgi:hypothetical protein
MENTTWLSMLQWRCYLRQSYNIKDMNLINIQYITKVEHLKTNASNIYTNMKHWILYDSRTPRDKILLCKYKIENKWIDEYQ